MLLEMPLWKLRDVLYRREWPSVCCMADTRGVVVNQSWRYEDALAQRIQRGVLLAEQEQSIATEFAEFLSWWKNDRNCGLRGLVG